MANFPERVNDEVNAEKDERKIQDHQGNQEGPHLGGIVISRRGDQHAQNRKREREDGDAGAQRGKGGPLLRQEKLDLIKQETIRAWLFHVEAGTVSKLFTDCPIDGWAMGAA